MSSEADNCPSDEIKQWLDLLAREELKKQQYEPIIDYKMLLEQVPTSSENKQYFHTICEKHQIADKDRVVIIYAAVEYGERCAILDGYPTIEARLDHLRKIQKAASKLARLLERQLSSQNRKLRFSIQINNATGKLTCLLQDKAVMDRWGGAEQMLHFVDLKELIDRLPNSAQQLAEDVAIAISNNSQKGYRGADVNKLLFDQTIHDILFAYSEKFPTTYRSGPLVEILAAAHELAGLHNPDHIAHHAARGIVKVREHKRESLDR